VQWIASSRSGFPLSKTKNGNTNLAPFSKENFSPFSKLRLTDKNIDRFLFPETIDSHVVLVNGILREDLSRKTKVDDIVAIDLLSAIADALQQDCRNYLARNANYHDRGLTRSIPHFCSRVFCPGAKNTKLASPLQITYVADSPTVSSANFGALIVVRRIAPRAWLNALFRQVTRSLSAVTRWFVADGAVGTDSFATGELMGISCRSYRSGVGTWK
jgi:hypothetical protein